MTLRIFRVTVRGRFGDLADPVRERLLADAADHDVSKAGFTEAGTLTYEPSLHSFTFRFRLRDDSELDTDANDTVVAAATSLAEAWLTGLGASWCTLRVDADDMADVWSERS